MRESYSESLPQRETYPEMNDRRRHLEKYSTENIYIPLNDFRKDTLLTFKKKLNSNFLNETKNISKSYLNKTSRLLDHINYLEPREDFFGRNRDIYLEPLINPRENLERALEGLAHLYPSVQNVVIPRTLDQTQVMRIGQAVDGLAIIRSVFGDIPDDQLQALLDSVESSLSGSVGQERAKLIKALFSASESSNFSIEVSRSGLNLNQLPGLILNEGVFALVDAMLASPEKYRMQLGVILSQINFNQLPDGLKERLKPHMSGLEFTLETSHEGWWLCPSAEPRLIQSISDTTVMAIEEEGNPYFLVKFRGKLSALCLRDITTSDGKVFIRGNWYSPTDAKTRDALKNGFDEGKGRLTLQKGKWALMRPIKTYGVKTTEILIEEAVQVAKSIPEIYTNDEVDVGGFKTKRREYRESLGNEI